MGTVKLYGKHAAQAERAKSGESPPPLNYFEKGSLVIVELLQSGNLSALHLGLTRDDVRQLLGEPPDYSEKSWENEIWKYRGLQVAFSGNSLSFIGLYFEDSVLNLPPTLVQAGELSLMHKRIESFEQLLRANGIDSTINDRLTFGDQKVLHLTESRVLLWTWKALRDLGERPSPKVSAEVQGVVCELHNEAGVGTIAAYSDGRTRWIGGQGAMTVWELPGTDLELDNRIRELLESAEPLIRTAPFTEKHKTPEPKLEHFRVSILTYGGIHTVEVFGPDIHEGHRMAPILLASVKLVNTYSRKPTKPRNNRVR